MNKAIIIAAGGVGKRMNLGIPKQFINIAGKPILIHTLEIFYEYDPFIEIFLVLPKNYINEGKKILTDYNNKFKVTFVEGGETRYHSVKNALKKAEKFEIIAIHDAVRPFINAQFLSRLIKTAEENGSAVPVIKVSDTIKEITDNHVRLINRDNVYLLQTPQVFKKEWLLKAYETPYNESITDDSTLLEKNGYKLTYVEGLRYNIKITTQEDLLIADYLIKFNYKNV